jgi:DNA polymerase-4
MANHDPVSDLKQSRCVLHADLDAFYASVEQMDDPSLLGRPVLVGGKSEDRGVVATCSYEARRFGIHSAMPMRTALIRCPQAVVVRPRFGRYRQASERVMGIFRLWTPMVQAMSLDEAFLDVSAEALVKDPVEIASHLKQYIKSEVGLTISIGVATSKTVAKIASDMDKPDGLVVVAPGDEGSFLAALPVRRLPGIGPKAESVLKAHGIFTLQGLSECREGWLTNRFGKRGTELRLLAMGLDDRPVITQSPTKSISAEITFPQDLADAEKVYEHVAAVSLRVMERLRRSELQGKTVTLKLRLSDFTTLTRSMTRRTVINDYETLKAITSHLLQREIAPGRTFRLVGVGVSNFVETHQLPLF